MTHFGTESSIHLQKKQQQMCDLYQKPISKRGHICPDLFKPYQYVRESNCLTNFLDHGYFATQNLDGDKNQFAAKITKPPAKIMKPLPVEITKPNHVLALTGTGFHKSVKLCKSLR